MHLQARLKAKIPIKALARFHAQKKFKSKIKNVRFTHLFKSVSQYCEFNKVQQECLWVFFCPLAPRGVQVLQWNAFGWSVYSKAWGDVFQQKNRVLVLFLTTAQRRWPHGLCNAFNSPAHLCSKCSSVVAFFPVHLHPLLAQPWRHLWVDGVVRDLLPALPYRKGWQGATTDKN